MKYVLLSVLFSLIIGQHVSYAQDTLPCSPKNLTEVLFKKKHLTEASLKIKKPSIILLPVIGASPATGAFFGVGGVAAFFVGKDSSTRMSSTNLALQYTTKNQFILMLKTNVYTNDNRFFLQGDIRLLIYNQPTYGLGTNSPDSSSSVYQTTVNGEGTNNADGAQPISYNYLKVHQIVSKTINKANTLFLGAGYHLDHHYSIVDADLDVAKKEYTSHYIYCKSYGFDTAKYVLSGISGNFVFDTRDNIINPYKGYYVQINARFNETWLGSSAKSAILWAEFRHYISLSKTKGRHILGLWAWANMQLAGHAPYMDLPGIGYDTKGVSGRGYAQGRFRGEQMVYGEVEWRFPISKCSEVLGGVIFTNFTTATNLENGVYLFESIKPGIGAGLRIMLDKRVRTNMCIDYGVGKKSQGFYMNAGEVF